MFSPACIGRGITVLAVALCPLAVSAQPSAAVDSSPFRAGQWGAEFGLGNFASAGVLRFRSPTRAWLGSISSTVQRNTRQGDRFRPTELLQLDLSLGHRWYRPVTASVWQYLTVGALVGYQTSETSARLFTVGNPSVDTPQRISSEQLAAGVLADLGAQWMVTSQLALGASWQAQAAMGRQTTGGATAGSGGADQTSTTLGLSLGRVAIRGTLYF